MLSLQWSRLIVTEIILSEASRHAELKVGSERNFGLVFSTVFWIVAFIPMVNEGNPRVWAIVVASIFLVLSLALPKLLAPLNKLWFRFGLLLEAIINPIVMSLLFFIAVVPTGLIMRILGKDLLCQKTNKSANTYWNKREEQMGPMKNQF